MPESHELHKSPLSAFGACPHATHTAFVEELAGAFFFLEKNHMQPVVGQRKRGCQAASGVQTLAAEFRPCPVEGAVEVGHVAAGAAEEFDGRLKSGKYASCRKYTLSC